MRCKTSLCSLCPTNTSTFICAGVDFAAGLRLHHQPFVVQFYQSGIAQPALWRARRGLWSECAQWPPSPTDPISLGGTFEFNPEPDSKATSLSQVWLVMGNAVKGEEEGTATMQSANLIKVNCVRKIHINRQGVEIHFNSTWVCLGRLSLFSFLLTLLSIFNVMFCLLGFNWKNNLHVNVNQTMTKPPIHIIATHSINSKFSMLLFERTKWRSSTNL